MAWSRARKRGRRILRTLLHRLSAIAAAGEEWARWALFGALRFASPAAQRGWDALGDRRVRRQLAHLRSFLARHPDLRLAITCTGRRDGAGGQALSVISALAFAYNHRCRYLHTPFRQVAHVEGDPGDWTRRWEKFLGLGDGEAAMTADAPAVPIAAFLRRARRDPAYAQDPRAVVVGRAFGYAEMARSETRAWLVPRLRAKYHSADKSGIALFRTGGAINVAVHLRRGDVGPDDPRYTPDRPILATIAALRTVAAEAGRAISINLFSEGAPDQFAPFEAAGCALHLGTDPFEAFHNLVMADILVATASAFSRAAGMFSEGIVITPTRHWGADTRWLTRARDGDFDRARLAALLAAPDPAAAP